MKKLFLTMGLAAISAIGFGQTTTLPQECSFCSVDEDKFTGKVDYSVRTPNVNIYGGDDGNYIRFVAMSSYCTVSIDTHDIILLFTDGTTYTIRDSFDTDATTNGFAYSTFSRVNPELGELLKSKQISAFKLYIFDVDMNQKSSDKIMKGANCIF